MFKKIKEISVTVLLIMLITSCTPEESVNRTIYEPASSGGWTVMVWLDGDNNLEAYALQDLNEMEYGLYLAGLGDPDVTKKVKIIVQVDRYSGSSSVYTGDRWSDTRRYIIRPDSSDSTGWTSQRIDNDMGEVNMGDAANLKDFIEYCHTYFPADHYALILWNHGGGLRKKVAAEDSSYSSDETSSATSSLTKGICTDDTSSKDILYTGEITDVLTDDQSVDFLGFDACLMGMIEVAYEYRPGVTGKFGADAICFSPANEQGDGWDYVRILTRLGGDDSDSDTADFEEDPCYDASSAAFTPQVFATLCAKEYRDFCVANSLTTETQTAVDNTLVNNVKTAMDEFAAAISDTGVSTYKSVIEGIRGSGSSTVTMEYFAESGTTEWLNYPFFDLYDFARRVSANSSLNDAHTAADNLMSAINGFILYSYGGSSYSGFTSRKNGLSFFFTGGSSYLADQWWYTAVDTDSVQAGRYYGRLDFCEKGATDTDVKNWYELIMEMYLEDSGMKDSGYWPVPAY